MINSKRIFFAIALSTIAGLTAHPTHAQEAPVAPVTVPLSTALKNSPAQPQTAQEQAARDLIRKLGPLQSNGEAFYTTFATSAVEGFQSKMSRPLTDTERQQLYSFWHQQVQESLGESALEDQLVALYARDFTLEELTAINQFYETPAGMKQ